MKQRHSLHATTPLPSGPVIADAPYRGNGGKSSASSLADLCQNFYPAARGAAFRNQEGRVVGAPK